MIAKSKLCLCECYIKAFKNVDDKLSFNCTVGLLLIMLIQIYDDTSLHTNSRRYISSQMKKIWSGNKRMVHNNNNGKPTWSFFIIIIILSNIHFRMNI